MLISYEIFRRLPKLRSIWKSLSVLLPVPHRSTLAARFFFSIFHFFLPFFPLFLIHFPATSAIFPAIHPISCNCGKCQARLTARDVADANVLTPRSNCENSRTDSTLDTDTRNYFVQWYAQALITARLAPRWPNWSREYLQCYCFF